MINLNISMNGFAFNFYCMHSNHLISIQTVLQHLQLHVETVYLKYSLVEQTSQKKQFSIPHTWKQKKFRINIKNRKFCVS